MTTDFDKIKHIYGDFKYTDLSGGAIKIETEWIKHNIVVFDTEIFGTIECHRLVEDSLRAILRSIRESGDIMMIDIPDTDKNGGCFVPRHTLHRPDKPLSLHSWGIACDINPTKNPYGVEPYKTQFQIATHFLAYGWEWGGQWRTLDPMHFQVKGLFK